MSSIQSMYEEGEYYYSRWLEKGSASAAGLAAGSYWCAFVLGHPQAAFPLARCFLEEHGVKYDGYIAQLFFSVAESVKDDRCEPYKDLVPTEEIDDEVQELIKTFRQAQATFSHQLQANTEIDIPTLDKQFNQFSKCFNLYGGKTIIDCFTNPSESVDVENVPLTGVDVDNDDAS